MAAVGIEGVHKSFGATPVLRDVSLSVEPGEVLALLGPSGCGKTTLLRIVAGLEAPDAGEVRVGDRLLAGPGTFVPPERRRVGMVFQEWGLFPHLTVAQNVAYGLPRGERGRRASARVGEALAMVGLDGLGHRAPSTLSGGQQQRVALARALAPQPSVLLLDEPFSNLDAVLRVEVRTQVHRLLRDHGVTTIFVTHDQEEAFVLGHEVAVMSEGRLVQQAPPAVLYDEPLTPWLAAFVGDANLLPGRAAGTEASTPFGAVPLREPAAGDVTVLVRPEHVRLDPGGDGVVDVVEYYGHDTRYVVKAGDLVLHARAPGGPRLVEGDRVAPRYEGAGAVAWAGC